MRRLEQHVLAPHLVRSRHRVRGRVNARVRVRVTVRVTVEVKVRDRIEIRVRVIAPHHAALEQLAAEERQPVMHDVERGAEDLSGTGVGVESGSQG